METKRVVRLIVYEGPADQVDDQLARSLPDGHRFGGGKVKIETLTLTDGQQTRPVAGLRSVLDELPAAPFGDYARGPFGPDPVKEYAQDQDLLRFTRVHHLRAGERYLVAVDRGAMSEMMVRQLSSALDHMGVKVLACRVSGNPNDLIKVVDLPEPEAKS